MSRPSWLDEEDSPKYNNKQSGSDAPIIRDCPVNGCRGSLNDQGVCAEGGGYPEARLGPREVCQTCRGWLSWDGKCHDCWKAGRRDVVPGHRYELQDGHWVLTVRGPRFLGACEIPGCTMRPAEHVEEGMKAIRAMLAGVNGGLGYDKALSTRRASDDHGHPDSV